MDEWMVGRPVCVSFTFSLGYLLLPAVEGPPSGEHLSRPSLVSEAMVEVKDCFASLDLLNKHRRWTYKLEMELRGPRLGEPLLPARAIQNPLSECLGYLLFWLSDDVRKRRAQ